jgi:hypothetical protein
VAGQHWTIIEEKTEEFLHGGHTHTGQTWCEGSILNLSSGNNLLKTSFPCKIETKIKITCSREQTLTMNVVITFYN